MTYCGQSTIVKDVGAKRVLASLRCRSWSCPDCQPQRKRQLIAQAIGGSATIFLTLTTRIQPNLTPVQAAKNLAYAWRLTRLRIMRRYGWKKLPFLAVFEATVLGWPHLHILLRSAFIDHRFVSECMRELHDSPIVKFRKIDNRGRLAGYCASYCGKASQQFGKCKRYWMSQDYDLRDKPERTFKIKQDPFVYIIPASLTNVLRNLASQGYVIERTSAWKATATRTRAPP